MNTRAVTALSAVLMAGTAACGSSGGSAETATSFGVDLTSPVATVVEQRRAATEDYDVERLVTLTCKEFKDRERAAAAALLPTITDFATPAQAADPAFLADLERRLEVDDGMSPADAAALVSAIRSQDQLTFAVAAGPYVAAQSQVTDVKAERIMVDGNTATAQVTTTVQQRGEEPQTVTEKQRFIREDGVWVECTPKS